jgi:hypothetical protein
LLRSIFGNISRSSNFLPAKSGDSLIWEWDGEGGGEREKNGKKRVDEMRKGEKRKEGKRH